MSDVLVLFLVNFFTWMLPGVAILVVPLFLVIGARRAIRSDRGRPYKWLIIAASVLAVPLGWTILLLVSEKICICALQMLKTSFGTQ